MYFSFHDNHKYVSNTYVAFFRVVRTRKLRLLNPLALHLWVQLDIIQQGQQHNYNMSTSNYS